MKKRKTSKSTWKQVKPVNLRYCSYCGTEMLESLQGAEKNIMYYGDTASIPLDSKYNTKTGKRQYCYKYVCPFWEKKLFNLTISKHDNYFIDEIITL